MTELYCETCVSDYEFHWTFYVLPVIGKYFRTSPKPLKGQCYKDGVNYYCIKHGQNQTHQIKMWNLSKDESSKYKLPEIVELE